MAVVDENLRAPASSADVIALAAEESLHDVDDAWRIATPDHPIPYSPTLEDAFLPDAEQIAGSVKARLA